MTITVAQTGATGAECIDVISVELAEPLRDRRLIDGSSGEALELRSPEG